MVVYFSKMYQAVPALYELYKRTGGVIITTRISTFLKVRKNFPEANVRLTKEYLPAWWPSKKLMHNAALIITGSPNKKFLQQFSAKKVMVFHGTFAYADKNQLAKLDHFDYLFSIGPRMTNYLTQGGYEDKIIESGYLPFMGFSSCITEKKTNTFQQLNLSQSIKTILYMPRAFPFGSWDMMAEKLINETPRDFNLILRPHPSLAVKMHIGRQFQLRKIRKLCEKRGNAILDLSDIPLAKIFSITDLMICDGASSPEESLFYRIPIIFVETDLTSRARLLEDLKEQHLSANLIKKRLSIYNCGISMRPHELLESKISEALNPKRSKHTAQGRYFNWAFGEQSLDRQNNIIKFISGFN